MLFYHFWLYTTMDLNSNDVTVIPQNTVENADLNAQPLSQADIAQFGVNGVEWKTIVNQQSFNGESSNPEENKIANMDYENAIKHLQNTQKWETDQIKIWSPNDLVDSLVKDEKSKLVNELEELSQYFDKPSTDQKETITEEKPNTPDTKVNEDDPMNDYVVMPYSEEEIQDAMNFYAIYKKETDAIIWAKKKLMDYELKEQEISLLKEQIKETNQEVIALRHNTVQVNDPLEMSIVNSMKSFKESKNENSQYALLSALNNAIIKTTDWAVNFSKAIDNYFTQNLWGRVENTHTPNVHNKIQLEKQITSEDISMYGIKL